MRETGNTQERMNAAPAYEAPQVEIIEVAVEKGYATTGAETYSLRGYNSDDYEL